jgi:putative FmdB family regulatory protein
VPTYVYECPCGQIYDVVHSITEDPDVECDNCGGVMDRIPQAPRVSFSGPGFYSTDKNN